MTNCLGKTEFDSWLEQFLIMFYSSSDRLWIESLSFGNQRKKKKKKKEQSLGE